MNVDYLFSWESVNMEWIGGGDPDVFTKGGRYTEVKLDLTKPAFEQQAHRLKVHLVYDVIEVRRNNTHLQMNTDILIPVPADWVNVRLPGAADFKADLMIAGKNHRWNSIDVNEVDWIQTMEAKIDGPGDDTEGNAGVRINFAIPLEYTEQQTARR